MPRKQRPGLSRERLRVFAQVLEDTAKPEDKRLLHVLGYILGDVAPDELGRLDPRLVAPMRAAEALR